MVSFITEYPQKTPITRGALDTALCDKVCQWLATVGGFHRLLWFPICYSIVIAIWANDNSVVWSLVIVIWASDSSIF